MRALLATALIAIATPCFAQNMDVRAYDDAFVLGQRSAQAEPKLELPAVHPPCYPFENIPGGCALVAPPKPTQTVQAPK